jgi:hypothetical protein
MKQRGNLPGNRRAMGALTRQSAIQPFEWSVRMNWDRVEGNWKQFAG